MCGCGGVNYLFVCIAQALLEKSSFFFVLASSAVRVEEEADWDSGLVALSLVVSAVWEVIVKKEERRGRRERPT